MPVVFLLLLAVLLIIGLTSKRRNVKFLSGCGLIALVCLTVFVIFVLIMLLMFFMNH